MKHGPHVTRRAFCGGAIFLAAAPWLGCGRDPIDAPIADAAGDGAIGPPADAMAQVGKWTVPAGTALPPLEFARLQAVFDALIPGDAASPGAALTGAAWYLDQLLGAFRTDPPRIFAGGPFSGRHGGLDGFAEFQPLTRVETLRWRTFLEGSQGLAEREWNGPVVGLRAQVASGLDAIAAQARASHADELEVLDRQAIVGLLAKADKATVQLLYEYAVEGTYGDPVYGGNRDRLGWQAIDYEGDRQPIGYTARQMAHPEEG